MLRGREDAKIDTAPPWRTGVPEGGFWAAWEQWEVGQESLISQMKKWQPEQRRDFTKNALPVGKNSELL